MAQPMIPVPDRQTYQCYKCGQWCHGFGAITAHIAQCTNDRRPPCPHCGTPVHASVVCPPAGPRTAEDAQRAEQRAQGEDHAAC
jgi:DNA-directed RNA polymerase subunit RPC12/RpoP